MKKLLLILCLFSMTAYAQSNLPPCNGNRSGPCFEAYEWPSGEKYVGQWKDNERNGQGTYTFASGDKYVGQYRDNKRNGQGTYTFASGAARVADEIQLDGILLYPATTEEFTYDFSLRGSNVKIVAVDLRKTPQEIHQRMLEIIR